MAETTPAPSDDLEPTLRGSMTGMGETDLAFARWERPEPRGRVVIAHGYGEHGERYGHVARWLNGQGWSVSAMDHRGFGRSGGPRGDADGIRGAVEDLTLFLRQERARDAGQGAGGRPQVLLGHSFGGLVALLVVLLHPETVEALILSSPALKLRELPLPLKILRSVFGCVAPHHPLELPSDKAQVCSDPAMVQRYLEDPLCHRFITAGFVASMLEGRREVLGYGAELDRPILLLEGDRDVVTDPDGAEPLWSAVRSGLLQRHRLGGFYHEIFHDLGRAEAERLTSQWLDGLFPSGKPSPARTTAMFDQA